MKAETQLNLYKAISWVACEMDVLKYNMLEKDEDNIHVSDRTLLRWSEALNAAVTKLIPTNEP